MRDTTIARNYAETLLVLAGRADDLRGMTDDRRTGRRAIADDRAEPAAGAPLRRSELDHRRELLDRFRVAPRIEDEKVDI